jgi:hypothetical protein
MTRGWTDQVRSGKFSLFDRIMSRRTLIGALVVGVLLLGLPGLAAAKDAETVAKEKAAKKACAMGDDEKGADLLTDLFVATNDPVYIYNQARCYEQNSRWERAVSRFREYLRKAQRLTEGERAETERHIAECEAALTRAAPPATARPAEAPGISAPAGASAAMPTSAVAPSSPGRGLRIAGIVSGAAGLAIIGAGVGFALKTQSISSDEAKNGPTKAKEDERKRYETIGWVCYGVGAAALATGVVLYIVGWPSEESRRISVLPSVNATGGSLLLAGRF